MKGIATEADFGKAIKALYSEAIHANVYYKLHMALLKAFEADRRLLSRGHLFWQLVTLSALDNVMFRLCRLYDQNPRNLTLKHLVLFAENSPRMFTQEAFSRRIAASDYRQSLTEHYEPLDAEESGRHLEQVDADHDVRIKNLLMWRHKVLAHKDPIAALALNKWMGQYPVRKIDLRSLIESAFAILDRYSSLFGASTQTREILPAEPEQPIIRLLKEAIDAREMQMKRTRRQGSD